MSLQYFEEKNYFIPNVFLSQYCVQKYFVCREPYSYLMRHHINEQIDKKKKSRWN